VEYATPARLQPNVQQGNGSLHVKSLPCTPLGVLIVAALVIVGMSAAWAVLGRDLWRTAGHIAGSAHQFNWGFAAV